MSAEDAIVVGSIAPGEKREAAAVLARAFVTNPNCVAMLGGAGERERRKLEVVFRLVRLEHPRSKVLVAREGGRILGVLNSIDWPHCRTSPLRRPGILPELVAALGVALFRSRAVQRMWARHDPSERHSHLGPVGVLPRMQGRGIGRRMLERYCQLLDGRGVASFLETEKPENVRLYERFGFEIVAQADALGVHNWFMYRPASGRR